MISGLNILPNCRNNRKIIFAMKRTFFWRTIIIVIFLYINYFVFSLINSYGDTLVDSEAENIYTSCMKAISNPYSKNPHKTIINDPEVIIVVDSKVDDYESRCAIRAVWSHYSTKKLSHILSYIVLFQLGYKNNKVKNHTSHEQNLYGDLIIHNNIVELYSNVGKKLIASLELLNSLKNPSLKYIVKTDDDVYVVIHNYLTHLKSMINSDVDYEGLLFEKIPVLRDRKERNFEPSRTAVDKIYPPYCTGYGYYVKAAMVDCLIKASKSHENLRNGDTNVGYLLRFCNATMRKNSYYSYPAFANKNLADGIKLFKKNHVFYFLHGIRKFDQLIFDSIYSRKSNMDN